jgi:hypothetical protein
VAEVETIREVRDKGAATKLVAWLALLLSIGALTLAWMAYNRSGKDLEAGAANSLNQTVDKIQGQTQ